MKTLLESRTHGDSMFPLRVYPVDYLDGNVIFNMHWHHEIEFIYVKKGPIHFQVGTKQYTLTEDSGFFIPSEQLHGAYPSSDFSFEVYAIVVHLDFLRSFGYDLIESNYLENIRKFTVFHATFLEANSKEYSETIFLLRKIIDAYTTEQSGFEIKIKGYLYLLLAEILKVKAWENNEEISNKDIEKTELLKSVLKYIHKHYKEKLTVSELALQIQMSEGHFSRFFKSMVRMTPIEYVNNIRISKATLLLERTDRMMLDIAMDVGIMNQSYFNRLFKRIKGCTPIEYKMKLTQSGIEVF